MSQFIAAYSPLFDLFLLHLGFAFSKYIVLRAGVFELKHRREVPGAVAITEYVEVAKAFFGEDEPRIVNAVLDRIGRELRPDELGRRESGEGRSAP